MFSSHCASKHWRILYAKFPTKFLERAFFRCIDRTVGQYRSGTTATNEWPCAFIILNSSLKKEQRSANSCLPYDPPKCISLTWLPYPWTRPRCTSVSASGCMRRAAATRRCLLSRGTKRCGAQWGQGWSWKGQSRHVIIGNSRLLRTVCNSAFSSRLRDFLWFWDCAIAMGRRKIFFFVTVRKRPHSAL